MWNEQPVHTAIINTRFTAPGYGLLPLSCACTAPGCVLLPLSCACTAPGCVLLLLAVPALLLAVFYCSWLCLHCSWLCFTAPGCACTAPGCVLLQEEVHRTRPASLPPPAPPAHYCQLLSDLEQLGWERVVHVSADFSLLKIRAKSVKSVLK